MELSFHRELTFLGTFRSKSRELAYEGYLFKKRYPPLPFVLAAAYGFFLLITLVIAACGSESGLAPVFSVWLPGCLLTAALVFPRGRRAPHDSLLTVNLFEFLLAPLFAATLLHGGKTDFLFVAAGASLLVTMLFHLPNLWHLTLLWALVFIGTVAAVSPFVCAQPLLRAQTAGGWLFIAAAFLPYAAGSRYADFCRRRGYCSGQRLFRMVETDSLTGASTRFRFDREMQRRLEKARGRGAGFAIAIFDVDDFKRVNDTYGHLAGDDILTAVTETVRANLPPQNTIARWGGEEFVLILPGAGLQTAIGLCERLRAGIAETRFCVGGAGTASGKAAVHVTCSFGVSAFQKDDTARTLLDRADRFLYDAKQHGKNAVVSGLR